MPARVLVTNYDPKHWPAMMPAIIFLITIIPHKNCNYEPACKNARKKKYLEGESSSKEFYFLKCVNF